MRSKDIGETRVIVLSTVQNYSYSTEYSTELEL